METPNTNEALNIPRPLPLPERLEGKPVVCAFGSAPEQTVQGYVGLGTVRGTVEDMMRDFEGRDVRLVDGGAYEDDPDFHEWYLMVRA